MFACELLAEIPLKRQPGKRLVVPRDDSLQFIVVAQLQKIGVLPDKTEPKAEKVVLYLIDAVLVPRFLEYRLLFFKP